MKIRKRIAILILMVSLLVWAADAFASDDDAVAPNQWRIEFINDVGFLQSVDLPGSRLEEALEAFREREPIWQRL